MRVRMEGHVYLSMVRVIETKRWKKKRKETGLLGRSRSKREKTGSSMSLGRGIGFPVLIPSWL